MLKKHNPLEANASTTLQPQRQPEVNSKISIPLIDKTRKFCMRGQHNIEKGRFTAEKKKKETTEKCMQYTHDGEEEVKK